MVMRILLCVCACLASFPVLACAMLLHGDPKVGSSVNAPVTKVALTFSGKIYPEQSTLEITDASGTRVSSGKPYGDDTTLITKVDIHTPGIYKVRWNTWCDCHSYTPGDYKFTVQ